MIESFFLSTWLGYLLAGSPYELIDDDYLQCKHVSLNPEVPFKDKIHLMHSLKRLRRGNEGAKECAIADYTSSRTCMGSLSDYIAT